MGKFLGHDSTFWTGIEALAVCAYTVAFTATLWLVYKEVRIAVKGFQLGAIQRMQQLIDDFRSQRRYLFESFPLNIALSTEQFPARPPRRHKLASNGREPLPLTEEQQKLVGELTEEQREIARHIIGRLNDIGELVEDGLIERNVFLGKYHIMIIQCCYMLEATRRIEEERRGGNYGQRLLRMRQWAIDYNDFHPKHRATPITITIGRDRRLLYLSPKPSLTKYLHWILHRVLPWYGSIF